MLHYPTQKDHEFGKLEFFIFTYAKIRQPVVVSRTSRDHELSKFEFIFADTIF